MRLVTFEDQHGARVGGVISRGGQDFLVDLASSGLPADMTALLAGGDEVLSRAGHVLLSAASAQLLPLEKVRLLAPVPKPGKILCLGHNYSDHTIEATRPGFPTIFGKTANTVIGPGQPVLLPASTQQVDYEAELAVVIGKKGRHIPEESAYACVAGYTIFNDISARDYQKRTSQWMIGKCFDGFGPMGPWLVTRDEIPDPHNLELRAEVDGFEEQHTHTSKMIFNIPYLIAYLSEVMTLEPGDIISTGTPGRTQRGGDGVVYLKDGEVVSIRISGLGALVTPFSAG